MERIFILEGKTKERMSGYDHVFSYFGNPADSFVQDYITEPEVRQIYNRVFGSVMDYLESSETIRPFSYRGVNLLFSFKKILFEFAYYTAHRYETFARLRSSHPGAQFYLMKIDSIFQYPGLSEVLPLSKAGDNPAIHILESPVHRLKQTGGKRSLRREKIPWPEVVKWGHLKQSQVGFFSDFAKSKSIVAALGPRHCAFFSNTLSPRTIVRALVNQTGLYQAAYRAHHEKKYQALVERYIALAQEHKPFSDFVYGEIEMGPLFQIEIVRLFQGALAKLLFEIDHSHQFFSSARSLKSVLLDEDANPAKNAFCQVARQYEVVSFVESHGALGHQIGVLPLTADWLFVWGRAQREKLIRWGCPADRVLVSGCSRFGPYQALDERAVKRRVAKDLKLDPSKKIILIAFSSVTAARGRFIFEDKFERNIREALEVTAGILTEFPEAQVILKARPGDEGLAVLDAWAKQNPFQGRVRVLERYDPLRLAKAADFLVVYASTYAVEGFALGKPVICLHDRAWDLLEEFREFSVFDYADDARSLRDSMRKMLQTNKIKGGRWEDAFRECLNGGEGSPEKVIVSHLLTPHGPRCETSNPLI